MTVTHAYLPGISQRIPVVDVERDPDGSPSTWGGGFIVPIVTREVLESLVTETMALEVHDEFWWDGPVLVVHDGADRDDDDEPTRILPDQDGHYALALGYVFADASDDRARGEDPDGVELWQDDYGWYVSLPCHDAPGSESDRAALDLTAEVLLTAMSGDPGAGRFIRKTEHGTVIYAGH